MYNLIYVISYLILITFEHDLLRFFIIIYYIFLFYHLQFGNIYYHLLHLLLMVLFIYHHLFHLFHLFHLLLEQLVDA